MTERVAERRLDDIRQMCDGPGDGFTQGEWCWAANDLLKELDAALGRVFSLETTLTRIARAHAPAEHLQTIARDTLAGVSDSPTEPPQRESFGTAYGLSGEHDSLKGASS